MEGGREKSIAVPRMFLRAVFQRLAGTPATQCKTWSPADLKKSINKWVGDLKPNTRHGVEEGQHCRGSCLHFL